MKPSILIWIYLVLGCFVLDAGIGSLGSSFLQYTIIDDSFRLIFAAMSIAAIIGLSRRVAWAKIVAFIVIVADRIITTGLSTNLYLTFDIEGMALLLASSLIFSIPLLFLAYKIYTSEPLKIYLSKSQPSSR